MSSWFRVGWLSSSEVRARTEPETASGFAETTRPRAHDAESRTVSSRLSKRWRTRLISKELNVSGSMTAAVSNVSALRCSFPDALIISGKCFLPYNFSEYVASEPVDTGSAGGQRVRHWQQQIGSTVPVFEG